MAVRRLTTCNLSELQIGMPGLTIAAGGFLAEAAAICLEDQQHQPGVQLSVEGSYNRNVHLTWNSVSRQQKRTYADMQESTEYGAAGIAILVLKSAAGRIVIERSKKGSYFDYWLGTEGDGQLFQNRARLEVSGILSGDQKKVESRVEQKLGQIKQAKGKLTRYVAVVEFGTPKARIVKR